jgi:integrase
MSKSLKRRRNLNGRVRPITLAEVSVLLTAIQKVSGNPWGDALFIWVFLMTGAPARALLNLRLRDVDPLECTLTLRSARGFLVMPLPDFMIELVRDFAAAHAVSNPHEHVFTVAGTDGTLSPMTVGYLRNLFADVAAVVTLPGVHVSLDGLWEQAVAATIADVVALGPLRPRDPNTAMLAGMVARWGGCHPWLHDDVS